MAVKKSLGICILILWLAGCAGVVPTKPTTSLSIWVPSPEKWEEIADHGEWLVSSENGRHHISSGVAKNLLAAKRRLEAVSGVMAGLGIIDSMSETYCESRVAVGYNNGKPTVGFSLFYLSKFGADIADIDVIAVSMAHELAHIKLGHLALNDVQQKIAVAPEISRAREWEAEKLGLKWVVEAGYDPCGNIRSLLLNSHCDNFLTHPDGQERVRFTNKFSKRVNGRACEGF